MIDYNKIEEILEETIEAMWGFPYREHDSVVKMIAGTMESNGISTDDLDDICHDIVKEHAGEKWAPNPSIIIDKINNRQVHKSENAWEALPSCERCIEGIGYDKDLKPVLCQCAKGTEHPQRKMIPFSVGDPIPLDSDVSGMMGLVSGAVLNRLKERLK